MLTGTRSGYWVVQWSYEWDPSLEDLLAEFPEFVLGRYVAIASCDSGTYKPGASDFAKGWEMKGDIAISPEVRAVDDLPAPGFDEWYVYEQKPAPYSYQSFVNTFGFSPLTSSEKELSVFWGQVEATRPLHVLGAGTPTMFVVTRDEDLFHRAKRFNTSLDTDPAGRSA